MKKTLVALALGTLALNSFGYINLIKGDGGYVSVKGYARYTFQNETFNKYDDSGVHQNDNKTTKHDLTLRLDNDGKFFISEGNVVSYLVRLEKPWFSSHTDKNTWQSKEKKFKFETEKKHGEQNLSLRRAIITIETDYYGKIILGLNGYKSLGDNTIYTDTAESVWGPRTAYSYFIKENYGRSITYTKWYKGFDLGISYADTKNGSGLKHQRVWAGKVSYKPADKWTIYGLLVNSRENDEVTIKVKGEKGQKDTFNKTGKSYSPYVATTFDVMAEYYDRDGLGFKVFAGYGNKTVHKISQPLWNHNKISGYALGMDVKYNVHKYFLPYVAVGLNTEREVTGYHDSKKNNSWTTKETNYKTVVYNLGFSSLLWEGENRQSVKFLTEFAHQVKTKSETKEKQVNNQFHSRLIYNF